MLVFRLIVVFFFFRLFHGNVVGSFLGGERGNRTGHQDHQDRSVQDTFIQQADRFAVRCCSQNDIITDHHCGQCGGCLCITKSENNASLVYREPERFLGQPCGRIFGGCCHNDHHNSDFNRLKAGEKSPVIDQHSDT